MKLSRSSPVLTAALLGSALFLFMGRRVDAQQAAPSPLPPPGPAPTAAPAAEGVEDLLALSLEELLGVEITPINVLGSHTHLQGERMFGYRYMRMNMRGEREGTRNLRPAEVLERYPVAHTNMTMEMHMLEAMYAPTDRLSLMAMLPYLRMSMGHVNRAGVEYMTESEGIGDLLLMGLFTVRGDPRQRGDRLLVNAGLSLPAGSTNERHPTPTRPDAKLEYPMQLGSGTFDLYPGVTYLGEAER